jgi:hypothetical protein
MVTFAKFHPPYDARNLRIFSARCAEIVWGCLEQWGGDAVRDWYWCIWNEPNNALIGGGLTFDEYRRIYEEVAWHNLRPAGAAPEWAKGSHRRAGRGWLPAILA